MSRIPMRFAAAALCAALPLIAAADTTADQAASLRQQLREWVGKLVGPDVPVPDKLIVVSPEGDHYHVVVSLASLPGVAFSEGGSVSASARPAAGGRWTIDDLQVASPAKMTIVHPDKGGTGAAHPTEVTATFGKYLGKGVLDPAFATPSTMDVKLDSYDVTANSSDTQHHTKIDSIAAQANLTPAANGKLDFTETASADNYSSTTKTADQPLVELAAQHLRVKLHVNTLDPDRALPLIRVLTRLSGAAMPATPAEHPQHAGSHIGNKEWRDLYVAFRGFASGGEMNETVEGVRISAGGHIIGLERLGVGGNMATPADVLTAHLALDLGGLSLADVPQEAREYVPHHLTIKPRISGISLADLDALIMAATAPESEKPDLDARIAALFSHGGIVVGLDALDFDLGPARLSGTGKLTAHSPADMTADANVKATGFDALISKAQANPALAQGVPMLAIARSLAKPNGQDLVWAVRMDKGVVTVNGRDLSALFGGGKKEGPAQ
jgi:hypothetical protein